ncbi:MAG TPA: chromate efflux transporter [Usitatibacter sp.]|nr:chromate efflux transporter [Usitatibacter sp.]
MNRPSRGSAGEVFATFLRLGLTSFGGPIAHLGYYRRELVERRGWITEAQYAELVGLCQFLPGPASTQTGFSLGLLRAGWAGALAAFVAFTLPSALLMFAFAVALPDIPVVAAVVLVHGLKLVAVAVVAHGLMGMGRRLCPDATRAGIAVASAAALLAIGQAWMQLAVVAFGALAGLTLCRGVAPSAVEPPPLPHGRRTGLALLALYAVLLVALPVLAAAAGGLVSMFSAFYRAGALVFGGGHVVLPLLQETVVRPGWVSRDDFLAGYGAAQAVPGPMFALAAYLGARIAGAIGAAGAVIAIFLPGLLLVSAALPLWRTIAARPGAARAVAGINASVVGLLAAAFYDPVWKSAVASVGDLAIAAVGFAILAAWRASALWVVVWCVAGSAAKAAWA